MSKKKRGEKSYRSRLQADLELCRENGMTSMAELLEEKIEEYKKYQREYYHKNKKDSNNA